MKLMKFPQLVDMNEGASVVTIESKNRSPRQPLAPPMDHPEWPASDLKGPESGFPSGDRSSPADDSGNCSDRRHP